MFNYLLSLWGVAPVFRNRFDTYLQTQVTFVKTANCKLL